MPRSSSDGTSSAKDEFSGSDSDGRKLHGSSIRGSRPRRVPTSNSKNAVAARMNRIKRNQYVKDLERKMSVLRREIKSIKKELADREKKWAMSVRQVSYLRSILANSDQIGHLLRNIPGWNMVPQGSNIDKTLNELNSVTSVDRSPVTTIPSLFDGCFDLLEEEIDGPYIVNYDGPAIEEWGLFTSNDPPSTEFQLFQDTVPSKHVSVCTVIP